MYLPLGYLLAHSNMKKIVRCFVYIFALAGLLLHICGTYILSIQADEIVNTYKGYTNLTCVCYSIGICVFIRYELSKLLKLEFFKKIINYLGNYTFGLYLLHIYVLWSYTSIFHPDGKSLLYRLTSPFIILIICTMLISVLRKFPGVKKIIP